MDISKHKILEILKILNSEEHFIITDLSNNPEYGEVLIHNENTTFKFKLKEDFQLILENDYLANYTTNQGQVLHNKKILFDFEITRTKVNFKDINGNKQSHFVEQLNIKDYKTNNKKEKDILIYLFDLLEKYLKDKDLRKIDLLENAFKIADKYLAPKKFKI